MTIEALKRVFLRCQILCIAIRPERCSVVVARCGVELWCEVFSVSRTRAATFIIVHNVVVIIC